MWRELEKFAKQDGMTILVTTHYLEEADRLCDRLAIVDGGKIVAAGTPNELKSTLRGDMIHVEIADGGSPETAEAALGKIEGLSNIIKSGRTLAAQAEDAARKFPRLSPRWNQPARRCRISR